MKIQFSTIADGMVWGTLPLMGGLFYWEHTLRLLASGHRLVQFLLLLVVFGWAYYWNMQAEYTRLRHLMDSSNEKQIIQYHLVTVTCHDEDLYLTNPVFTGETQAVSKDEPVIQISLLEMQSSFEARYHVTNN
jgi:hypothetical protein